MVRPRALCLLATTLLAAVLSVNGCDRGVGPTARTVEVRGLPSCPPRTVYARPVVVRLDRERSLFDEPLTVETRIEQPTASATLTVPRTRMRATIRAGLCVETSLATWDCAAASWVAITTVDLDGRASVANVLLPPFEAPCGKR